MSGSVLFVTYLALNSPVNEGPDHVSPLVELWQAV